MNGIDHSLALFIDEDRLSEVFKKIAEYSPTSSQYPDKYLRKWRHQLYLESAFDYISEEKDNDYYLTIYIDSPNSVGKEGWDFSLHVP
jgi:hypothetical protein